MALFSWGRATLGATTRIEGRRAGRAKRERGMGDLIDGTCPRTHQIIALIPGAGIRLGGRSERVFRFPALNVNLPLSARGPTM